jgi:hypothetical protein
MGMLNKALAGIAASAMLAAPAQAGCWSETAYQAAQVRELDTMLMVQALRCRKTAANFVNEYNRFVQISRPALLKANAELKMHFAREVGERGALNAYDNYMTTVANRYGAGADGLGCEDIASIVAAATAAGTSADELYRVAAAADMQPVIDGQRCVGGGNLAVTIASRR